MVAATLPDCHTMLGVIPFTSTDEANGENA